MNKRTFLKQAGLLGMAASLPLPSLTDWMATYASKPANELAGDEAFWEGVRGGYRLKSDYINLENGYYCFLPQETLESYISNLREVNLQGSYYMRTVQWDNKRAAAAALAQVAGCSPEELVITRNTTESLDLVISGFDWKAGDEAVMAEQDYGSMLDMFNQVSKRYGVVNKVVSLPLNPTTDEELVSLYANAITAKTKLLMISHMVNITGQILPVRKICDMAHAKGVPVLVDGAHAFAHITYSLRDLGCDYYGTSLHKWLSVPLGAGFLYVKKEDIGKVWPLFGDEGRKPDDVYRLNHIGTHPVATDLTIINAIAYYQKIGAERKEARLRFLQNYWSKQLRSVKNVVINTPVDPSRSCGIANVGIAGMSPGDMAKILLERYNVWTVAIDGAGVHGCRITPNIYTTPAELDTFVRAVKEMAAR